MNIHNITTLNGITLIFIIITTFTIIRINSKSKLNQGEKEVNKILNQLKDSKVLNDIMIKRDSGTSQIDHILISKKGIFVIETKDYNGEICGEQYSKYWLQIINKNKIEFYNPIRQNYGHIKALEECLEVKGVFISLIVFTNKSKLGKIKTEIPVIQLKKLKRFLKNYKSDINLSKNEMEYIYNVIKKINIRSRRIRRKHAKWIIKNIS